MDGRPCATGCTATTPRAAGLWTAEGAPKLSEGQMASLKAPSKRGFAACLTIAAAHPEAQRFEIWSQDEARVGRGHRLCLVAARPYPAGGGCRLSVGLDHRAVCPARDTGVALVLTRLDTAAMNLFLAGVAALLARTQPDRAAVAISRQSPVAPRLSHHRRDRRQLLRGVELAARRGRIRSLCSYPWSTVGIRGPRAGALRGHPPQKGVRRRF